MKVCELKPGYEIYNQSFDSVGIVAAVTEHPQHQGFSLVVWFLPLEAKWSIDCLSPLQEVGTLVESNQMSNLYLIFRPLIGELDRPGAPSKCNPETGYHTIPHKGCILR
jgi:hypothetical protein